MYICPIKNQIMKPLGRLKNIKGGLLWKQAIFKIGNWWEEMSEPISNKSARRKIKQEDKKLINGL